MQTDCLNLRLLLRSFCEARGFTYEPLADAWESAGGGARSLRETAKRHGVPESTLRRWFSHFREHVRAVCEAEGIDEKQLMCT